MMRWARTNERSPSCNGIRNTQHLFRALSQSRTRPDQDATAIISASSPPPKPSPPLPQSPRLSPPPRRRRPRRPMSDQLRLLPLPAALLPSHPRRFSSAFFELFPVLRFLFSVVDVVVVIVVGGRFGGEGVCGVFDIQGEGGVDGGAEAAGVRPFRCMFDCSLTTYLKEPGPAGFWIERSVAFFLVLVVINLFF